MEKLTDEKQKMEERLHRMEEEASKKSSVSSCPFCHIFARKINSSVAAIMLHGEY